MQTKLRDIFSVSKCIYFVTLILAMVFQAGVYGLWAEEKTKLVLSLSKIIELALDYNSRKRTDNRIPPPEDIIFSVKKYYYQIQTQVEQLETAEEVRAHFQKAVNKSEKIYEEGEENVSQSDITKLKLGLSDALNDIISLKYSIQIARLHLGELIGKEISSDINILKTDILPISFLYSNFDIYLEQKSLFSSSNQIKGAISVKSSETSTKISAQLGKEDRLTLHKAFITAKKANAKVMLGKKNRKITRALLVAEVANYDFGIGDAQELFEALIIYTRVLSGYLDSIFTLNVAVAELEKLTDSIFKKMNHHH